MFKRVITGFVLAPIVIGVILYAPLAIIAGLNVIIVAVAAAECVGMSNRLGLKCSVPFAVAVCAVFPVVIYGSPAYLFPCIILAAFASFIFAIYSTNDFKEAFGFVLSVALAIVYLAVPLSHVTLLATDAFVYWGRYWLLFALLLVWSNDTFAYATGKLIGKHKIAPKLSPGKTFEGCVGGLVGGVIVAFIFNRYAGLGLSAVEITLLSVVLGFISIYGDLFESALKRGAGVKDSGNIFPGHGGMLDRIDSMVFVIPILYYYLLWRGAII